MNHFVADVFAQPITRIQCDIEGVCEFFDNVIKPKNDSVSNKLPSGSNPQLRHYHNFNNIFNIYSELKDLHDEILEKSNFVYRKVMNYGSDVFITSAWINECQIGGSQDFHNHSNSMLCGTLYLRTDKNTEVLFNSPYGVSKIAPNLCDKAFEGPNEFGYSYHQTKVSINPDQGDCWIWPSFLAHGYFSNQTPNRLSLSFNLMPVSFNSLYKPHHTP
jgi:uncharacterized protein (TIGR02466 family)